MRTDVWRDIILTYRLEGISIRINVSSNESILCLVWIRKTNYMSLFVFFISLLIVAQHVSGNHVPIIRS